VGNAGVGSDMRAILHRVAGDESILRVNAPTQVHRQNLPAAKLAGGYSVVPGYLLDAVDDAAQRFYRHHDFVAVPGSERHCLKVATAELALRR
jgi:hypothetical protein